MSKRSKASTYLASSSALAGVHDGLAWAGVERGQGGPGPLQGAVHRGHAGAEQFGHLRGLPPQHLAQDQGGPLARRQVLQGGDERQADGLAFLRQLGGVGFEREDSVVGDGGDPGALRQECLERRIDRGARRAELHRPGPALAGPEHVQAHVGGDAVQPRTGARAPLETIAGLPRPHQRFLDGVLGVEPGPEHPVAISGELPPVSIEFLGCKCAGADRHNVACYVAPAAQQTL